MYIGIIGQNTEISSSCTGMVNYLLKEEKNKEQEHFFNHNSTEIFENVIEKIDKNRGKLKLKESNFYQISINPSPKELSHLNKISDLHLKKIGIGKNHNKYSEIKDSILDNYMKLYVKKAMESYAENFEQRKENGQMFESKDLLWYAKIEKNREYNAENKDVIFNKNITLAIKKQKDKWKKEELKKEFRKTKSGVIIKEGLKKEGLQYHAHVLVSRNDNINDRENKVRLSPKTTVKKGTRKLVRYELNREKITKKELNIFLKNKGINKDVSELNSKELRKNNITKNEKIIKNGFDRNNFFQSLESEFDKLFEYNRGEGERFKNRRKSSIKEYSKGQIKGVFNKEKAAIKKEILGEDLSKISFRSGIENNIKNNIKMEIDKVTGNNPILKSLPKRLPLSITDAAIMSLKTGVKIIKNITNIER